MSFLTTIVSTLGDLAYFFNGKPWMPNRLTSRFRPLIVVSMSQLPTFAYKHRRLN